MKTNIIKKVTIWAAIITGVSIILIAAVLPIATKSIFDEYNKAVEENIQYIVNKTIESDIKELEIVGNNFIYTCVRASKDNKIHVSVMDYGIETFDAEITVEGEKATITLEHRKNRKFTQENVKKAIVAGFNTNDAPIIIYIPQQVSLTSEFGGINLETRKFANAEEFFGNKEKIRKPDIDYDMDIDEIKSEYLMALAEIESLMAESFSSEDGVSNFSQEAGAIYSKIADIRIKLIRVCAEEYYNQAQNPILEASVQTLAGLELKRDLEIVKLNGIITEYRNGKMPQPIFRELSDTANQNIDNYESQINELLTPLENYWNNVDTTNSEL